jgi:hypothetical protein
MATFDQLPAEQRAILELVVGRGQTYDELSGMLGMPTPRVRELAREALSELAPATAGRVDGDWRGQIADYVLGQQTGPEATATKGHLKRSEAARAWAYSLIDSLGHLYANGTLPEIPDADGSAAAPAAPAAEPEPPEPVPAAEPAAAEPVVASEAPAAEEPTREAPPAAAPRPARPRPSGAGLSPAAQAVVRRRRVIGGLVGLAVIVVAALAIAGVFSGGGGDKKASASTSTSTTGGVPTKLVSQGVLKPENGGKGTGIAVVLRQGKQNQLVVQAAKLEPTDNKTAYEVWLYNSASDSVPLGAQFTDQQGNLQGRGAVPANYTRFKYVVLSRESVGSNPKKPATVLLRAQLSPIPASQQTPTATTGG